MNTTRWILITLAWFAVILPVSGQNKPLLSPADVSRIAAADAAKISGLAYDIRYLSIANIPAEQRKAHAETIAFLLNSLSRERDIAQPVLINNAVLRIRMSDYGWSHEAFDQMGDKEPYHFEKLLASKVRINQTVKRVVKIWPGGKVANGEYWPAGTQYYANENVVDHTQQREHEAKKIGIASWLDPESAAYLVKRLQTRTPILRGDWFLANASLPPYYHDLLGLKTLDDVKELALFDKRADDYTQIKATVVISGGQARKVARNNRILKRINTAQGRPGMQGAWWQTQDFKSSVDERNVIHNFMTEKSDGSEIIFTLPNGLQGYFLVDGKGKRVDEVPIDIAVDTLAQDGRVRNGRSCIWCHSQGIQPFQSSFKQLVNAEALTDLGLNVYGDLKKTAELAKQIRRVFETPDFAEAVKYDNMRYGNLVKSITGRTAPANAALFLQHYDEYAEVPLDAEKLQYEAGISDLDVQAACKVKIDGVNNGVLLQRLMNLPIRRDHFEESYGEFMRRVVVWQKTRKQ